MAYFSECLEQEVFLQKPWWGGIFTEEFKESIVLKLRLPLRASSNSNLSDELVVIKTTFELCGMGSKLCMDHSSQLWPIAVAMILEHYTSPLESASS